MFQRLGGWRRTLEISEKFCPICKDKNEHNALICRHCGAALDKDLLDAIATARTDGAQSGDVEKVEARLLDPALIPADGIAVYVVGTAKPVFVSSDDQFIIGRRMEATREAFLDLSNLGGYLLGLSRRHAKIRRAGSRYEIIDLASTNGTWLNDEQLIPHQPRPLASGAQLRLGRMRFVVLFRTVSEVAKRS
ncbi:MAG TPA: FHA domain-containing protein [Anaerolineales bacterium]|nr:FHA domain-containing protein [Anaerolineales bacterium]